MAFLKVLLLSVVASSFALTSYEERDLQSCIRILKSSIDSTDVDLTKSTRVADSSFCMDKPNGNYPDPDACEKFYQCSNSMTYTQPCPTSLLYNIAKDQCDYPENVECGERYRDHGEVCYGPDVGGFGTLKVLENGALTELKLKHISGFLNCDSKSKTYRCNWGCNKPDMMPRQLGTVITTVDNHVVLPKPGSTDHDSHWWYTLPGYTVNSPEIIFTELSRAIVVTKDTMMKIWSNEELLKYLTSDNEGKHCVRVYAKIIKVQDDDF